MNTNNSDLAPAAGAVGVDVAADDDDDADADEVYANAYATTIKKATNSNHRPTAFSQVHYYT